MEYFSRLQENSQVYLNLALLATKSFLAGVLVTLVVIGFLYIRNRFNAWWADFSLFGKKEESKEKEKEKEKEEERKKKEQI